MNSPVIPVAGALIVCSALAYVLIARQGGSVGEVDPGTDEARYSEAGELASGEVGSRDGGDRHEERSSPTEPVLLEEHPALLSEFQSQLTKSREMLGDRSALPPGLYEDAIATVLNFLDERLPEEAEFVRANGLGVSGLAHVEVLKAPVMRAGGWSASQYSSMAEDAELLEDLEKDPMLAPVEWSVFDATGEVAPVKEATLFKLRVLQWSYLKQRASVLAELKIQRHALRQTALELTGDRLLFLDLGEDWIPHEASVAFGQYLELGDRYRVDVERSLSELGYRE